MFYRHENFAIILALQIYRFLSITIFHKIHITQKKKNTTLPLNNTKWFISFIFFPIHRIRDWLYHFSNIPLFWNLLSIVGDIKVFFKNYNMIIVLRVVIIQQ